MDGLEVSVYQALERTKGRIEGEDGRAKSGRFKNESSYFLSDGRPTQVEDSIS